jgi:hypothetical protein
MVPVQLNMFDVFGNILIANVLNPRAGYKKFKLINV